MKAFKIFLKRLRKGLTADLVWDMFYYLQAMLFKRIPLPGFVKEQINWRRMKMNPKCIEAGACVHCECNSKDLVYAIKACEEGCYPPLQTASQWRWWKRFLKFEKPVMSNPALNHWNPKEVDLGKVSTEDKVIFSFSYSGPWSITKVKPGCGSCTSVFHEDNNVYAEFAPSTLSKGEKRKKITVTLNTPTGEVYDELYFKAEVV